MFRHEPEIAGRSGVDTTRPTLPPNPIEEGSMAKIINITEHVALGLLLATLAALLGIVLFTPCGGC
jgi:hypothetical protein